MHLHTKTLVLPAPYMTLMLDSLKPFVTRLDIIGYCAAKNARVLSTELSEYLSFRSRLVQTYGEHCENGEYKIERNSGERFAEFAEKLEEINNVEHEVTIHLCTYRQAMSVLSGEEILAIDWMLENYKEE